jgi:hypothetical protein
MEIGDFGRLAALLGVTATLAAGFLSMAVGMLGANSTACFLEAPMGKSLLFGGRVSTSAHIRGSLPSSNYPVFMVASIGIKVRMGSNPLCRPEKPVLTFGPVLRALYELIRWPPSCLDDCSSRAASHVRAAPACSQAQTANEVASARSLYLPKLSVQLPNRPSSC